jgi:acetyl esterase/lipase
MRRLFWLAIVFLIFAQNSYSQIQSGTPELIANHADKKNQIEDFKQENPDLINSEDYKIKIKTQLRLKVIEYIPIHLEITKSDNQWITAYQKIILNSFPNNSLRDYWLYYYLNDHITNFGVKNIGDLIDEFNQNCANENYKKEINEYYQIELQKRNDHLIKTYKSIDGFDLDAHIFIPKDIKPNEYRPAIVYFHGGGFSGGKPDWHFGYNKNGFVAVTIEYRTYDRYGVMPFEAISDAKSAIRWIRKNSKELHIDNSKIVASGNSAGAALVVTTALLDSLDEPNEDLKISSKPDAMILNASGYDQTNKFGPVKDKNRLAKVSGINLVKPNAPPCLVIHGSDDWGIPISEANEFVAKMRANGNICEFKILEGAGHVPWLSPPYSTDAYYARQEFLKLIGYIKE